MANFIFKETFFHNIDEKGRLAIPSKWRKKIIESNEIGPLTISKGLDQCLFIFTEKGWEDVIIKRLKKMPLGKKKVLGFMRGFISGSSEARIDGQGRIMIPQNLREYAGLTEKVVLSGTGAQIEVWDYGRWNTYMEENQQSYEDFAREFFSVIDEEE